MQDSIHTAMGQDAAQLDKQLIATVLDIWQSVLGRAPIGLDDDFFALGGDSLRAIQIALRLEERLRAPVTLQELFEHPTIRLLSARLPPPQEGVLETIRALPRATPPPVSDMQEVHLARLADWKLLPMTHPQQNICVGYRIRGPLDEASLRRSVEWLCQRHEVLRTHFDVSTQPPTQRINPCASVDYELLELIDCDEADRETRARVCIDELKQRPFNCLKAPVIRFHLLRLSPAEAIFIVSSCHLIMDAWSIGLLQEELAQCYGRLISGQPPPAAPPAIQYADFALWQRDYYPQKAQRTLAYWRNVLRGFNSLGLAIPLTKRRPEKFEYRTAVQSRDISKTHAAVRAYCERQRVTAYSFYLSAYTVLLYQLSQHSSMLIFTPSAQRNRIELERVMGRFSRSLLLRLEFEPWLPFGRFINEVTNVYLQAQSNLEIWNVAFNALLPEMVYGEEEREHPLSYVAFSFETLKDFALPGLQVESVPIVTANGPWFDLNARVFTHGEHTRLNLIYNPDAYASEVSGMIADAYLDVIGTALENAGCTLEALASKVAVRGAAMARAAAQMGVVN